VFCPLPYRDTLMILRGLLILVIVIMLGVSVSERQLSSLTQRQEGVHAFTINWDYEGVYSIYILGTSYHIKGVYSVGEMINTDQAIIIKTARYRITIPTYIEFDCNQELGMLESGANVLIIKGLNFKKSLELYLTELPPILNVYIGHFR